MVQHQNNTITTNIINLDQNLGNNIFFFTQSMFLYENWISVEIGASIQNFQGNNFQIVNWNRKFGWNGSIKMERKKKAESLNGMKCFSDFWSGEGWK